MYARQELFAGSPYSGCFLSGRIVYWTYMRFFWLRCVSPFRSSLSHAATVFFIRRNGHRLRFCAVPTQPNAGRPHAEQDRTDCRWRDPSRGTHLRPCGEQAGRSCTKGCFLSKCHAIIDEPCYFLYTEHSATGTIFLLCHRLAITGKRKRIKEKGKL